MISKMFGSIQSYAVLCFVITRLVSADSPTYGLRCSENSFCKGANEECSFSRFYDPPCLKGRCACLPCYKYVNGTCTKKTFANNVGDACTGYPQEVISVPNSYCRAGKVLCQDASSSGPLCKGAHQCDASKKDNVTLQCGTGMICPDKEKVCRCAKSYMKFDADRQGCFRREFGDDCSSDSECRVDGRLTDGGFTSTNGACINGKCACSSNAKPVIFSYVDSATNEARMKTICVKKAAITDLGNNSSYCDTDPVAWSNEDSVKVCSSSFVCSVCPEDMDVPGFRYTRDGKCRKLNVNQLTSEARCGLIIVPGLITQPTMPPSISTTKETSAKSKTTNSAPGMSKYWVLTLFLSCGTVL